MFGNNVRFMMANLPFTEIITYSSGGSKIQAVWKR
jgi:hypothetical protein